VNVIAAWVSAAPDAQQRLFRQATHCLLLAIAQRASVLPEMVMKGGVLLAIRYQTGRMTRDVDFSTRERYADFAPRQDAFIADLDRALAGAAATLPYQLQLRVQSVKIEPRVVGNFQTLRLKIGYAPSGNSRGLERLNKGQSPSTLSLDYSFNEEIHDIECIGDESLQVEAYGEFTLIAEKLRAYLQQEERDRERGRDLYDLWWVLKDRVFSDAERIRLLGVIRSKAASRGIEVTQESLARPELIQRAERSFDGLREQVDVLPDFADVFAVVGDFWSALPWDAD
jgi:predicted nucleotidyltransferase component of viral defense system